MIKPGRRVGNTTRQVDDAIQMLFDGKEVIIADHSNFIKGHENLFKRVMGRLQHEHEHVKCGVSKTGNTFKIKLITKVIDYGFE